MKIINKIALAGALLPWAAAAQAEEGSKSDWQFATTMYVWVSDLEGNLRTAGEVQPVAVDLSYGDVLKHLKLAGMGALQARKGRLIFMADLNYVHLGADKGIGIRDDDLLDAELDAAVFTGTALAGYRAVEDKVDLDLMAGGRLVISDNDLKLSGPQRTVEGDVTESWVDPIVAAHLGIPVSSKTTLGIYADVGGFGMASDFTWQTVIGVQHRLSRHWHLSGGWRHYAVDYKKGYFLYDVKQSGPILGVRYDF
jgi:hypothetical protein